MGNISVEQELEKKTGWWLCLDEKSKKKPKTKQQRCEDFGCFLIKKKNTVNEIRLRSHSELKKKPPHVSKSMIS